MNKRDDIQEEALAIALKSKRVGLAISMGVGKTLIGLRYIDELKKKHDGENIKILVVAPKLSIFDSWKDDAQKFGLSLDGIDFTTYLSLTKHNPHDYTAVILDECHSLLSSHELFLTPFTGKILGLTGTPPKYDSSEKGRMVSTFCPIRYRYITDDAVDNNILNDYRILVHMMDISVQNNMPVTVKGKSVFYTSEKKNYDYWCGRLAKATSKKEEQICSVMRMRALMDFRTKEKYARKLITDQEEKCLVFCNTQEQADRLSLNSYHSNNPYSEDNLEMFKKGEIDILTCVSQLNEGVNIPDLKVGIMLHSYGNERKFSQRLGRLLRLNPDDTAYIHVLCYRNTVDEKWVIKALEDLDQSKIKYFNVNPDRND